MKIISNVTLTAGGIDSEMIAEVRMIGSSCPGIVPA